MRLKDWFVKPKEETFNVDDILIPVGDSKRFAEKRDKSFKEVDLDTWKHRLEVKIESLERENKRLKKYETLVDALFERLSHDDEFMRKFKRYVETSSPDMKVRRIEFKKK